MPRVPGAVIGAIWIAWLIYWMVAALGAKATLRSETPAERALHVAPLLACAVFLAAPRLLPVWLDRRFLPDDALVAWIGVAFVACGIVFAVWARRHLGGNWSGAVVLKAGHTLIRSGPYRLVRHPIYTGLLTAILGTVIAIGEWRGPIGFGFALLSIVNRVRAEDALMAQTFGAEYSDYRRSTPALLPFLV
jgi:protein-S-isoprenylcysteine O-methyltransferase Ste14